MEMDYLEIINNAAAEASETIEAEEVMRLKKIGNDAAVEYVNAINHVNEVLTKIVDADDADAGAIVYNEFISTVAMLLGEDYDVSRAKVGKFFNTVISCVAEEEP